MKRQLFVWGSLLVLGTLMASACTSPITVIRPSGNIVTREEEISGFDALNVSHAFTVDVRQGSDFRVVLHVDENVLDHLDVVKSGDTLKIGLEPGLGYSTSSVTMEAEVTMPELAGFELSGASRGTVAGFSSARSLDVNVSGASRLHGDIEAGDARFDVSGASEVILSGSADDIRLNGSGASTVDLEDFAVSDARVEVSGASKATVNASGTLDAEVSGASHVFYVGEPRLGNIDTSGASSISRK